MPDVHPNNLPYATAKSSRILGKIRVQPNDFRVDEVPAYPPSGDGEHLLVRFEKTSLTTPQAVTALARAMGVDPRAASWAGLKDRHAVTTQWASFHRGSEEAAARAEVPGVRVLSVARHTHKLKNGHLRSNRFRLRIRDAGEGLDVARALIDELTRMGCPNYFGEQRFGREGDNAARALAWLRGTAPAPRDRFQRKLLFSALQSAAFNDWLAARVTTGLLGGVVEGDLLRKEDTGGLFLCRDVEIDGARARRFEVSATGPMLGHKMRSPEGPALRAEQEAGEVWGLTAQILSQYKKYGEGTRRVCRIRPEEPAIERDDRDLLVSFTLPKGAYATVVLRELTKPTETDGDAHP